MKALKELTQSNTAKALLATALITTASLALAGGGGMGGLDVAETKAVEIRDKVFLVVGGIAGAYLLYLGIMVWMDKKTWGDFFQGVLGVAIIGSSIVLAAWAWTLFQ